MRKQIQDSKSTRMRRNSMVSNPPLLSNLHQSVQLQKQQRLQIQEKLQQYQRRSLKRDCQFRQILSKYMPQAYSQSKMNALYNDLTVTISALTDKIFTRLSTLHKNNEQYMDRRIAEIIAQMEKEVNKCQLFSRKEQQSIFKDIAAMQKLSKNIIDQNDKLRTKINQLQFTVKVLNQERDLLLEELQLKKIVNVRLQHEVTKDSKCNKTSKQDKKDNNLQTFIKMKTNSNIQNKSIINSDEQQGNNKKIKIREDKSKKIITLLKKQLERSKKKTIKYGTMARKLSQKQQKIEQFVTSQLNTINYMPKKYQNQLLDSFQSLMFQN